MPNPFQQTVTTLGETLGRTANRTFGIYRNDRLFHVLLLGQTGTGKSTLIKNMAAQDVVHGNGFCLIDPHGDLAEALKQRLPENAVYWDVADPYCPFGYNPLTYVAEKYRPLVASGIIDALKKQFADAWGARMEHLLRFALLALLSRSGSTLADIVPMFTDKGFRAQVLSSATDPEVVKFWHDEYAKMNYKNAFDGVAPIANKLGAFLSNPVVRKTLCKPDQPLRFRTLMDEGRPVFINLAKGRLGSDVSDVLGGLILAMIMQAAYSRVDQAEFQRRPFFVYVDEFHSFTTDAMAGMLSELRKFKVGLVLAGQHTGQINRHVLDSILGNIGTQIVFRLGSQDAPLMSRQLGGIDPESLINQPNYQMFIRLMIGGVQSKAFSARTLFHRHRDKGPTSQAA